MRGQGAGKGRGKGRRGGEHWHLKLACVRELPNSRRPIPCCPRTSLGDVSGLRSARQYPTFAVPSLSRCEVGKIEAEDVITQATQAEDHLVTKTQIRLSLYTERLSSAREAARHKVARLHH
eukprot:761684-Hanusia_phi.AAC.11